MPSRSSAVWKSEVVTTFVRRDLPVAALEAVNAVRAVLDESPVAALLDFHSLDDELVAAAPPLRDEIGIGERAPDSIPGRAEDAFRANFTIARSGYPCLTGILAHFDCPFVRSRKASSRSNRASSVAWYRSIHLASSCNRRRPSLQVRTRPTFSVAANPAFSSTWTCLRIPVRVIPKAAARSPTEASPRPSRSRMALRVGSDTAAKAASRRLEY